MFDKISSVYSPLRPIFVEIAQLCKVVQRGGGSPRRRKRCATLARGRHTSADLSADPPGPRFQSRNDDSRAKIGPAGNLPPIISLSPIGTEWRLRLDCKSNFVVKGEPPPRCNYRISFPPRWQSKFRRY